MSGIFIRALLLLVGILVFRSIARSETAAATTRPATQPAYEPTDSYGTQTIEGWTVHVSRALLKDHPNTGERVLALLRVKLFDVTRVVPAGPLARMREVPIWVEYDDHGVTGACYHPSRAYLVSHDYNPDKTRAVELGNARHFLSWSREQPCMVLHELSHAYHNQVLGFDNAEVKAAYDAAVQSHNYEHVLRSNGHTERHYALTNEKEYFAESCEAFFGTNDFYPFVRAELAQHDPRMYALLKKVWGIE